MSRPDEDLYKRMSHRELIDEMEGWENQTLADTDKTLIRVFRKAALECLASGDKDGFEKWQNILQKVEKGERAF